MEIKHKLMNGIELLIEEIGFDSKGNKKYMITDNSGTYGCFTWTPNGNPQESDKITNGQLSVLKEIKDLI